MELVTKVDTVLIGCFVVSFIAEYVQMQIDVNVNIGWSSN